MKRFWIALACVLHLQIGIAEAQVGVTFFPGPGMPAATSSAATATYVGPLQTEASGGSTITYSAVPLGTASSKRVIAVVVGARTAAAARSVTGVTVGGNAATQVSGAAADNSSNGELSDIWYYADAGVLGTSATIIVTYSGTTTATGVQVYAILTSTPAPAVGTGQNAFTINATSLSVTMTVPSNGVGIVGNFVQSGATVSYTNATLDNSGVITGTRTLAVGHTTSTGSLTITGSFTTSPATMSSAAWGP